MGRLIKLINFTGCQKKSARVKGLSPPTGVKKRDCSRNKRVFVSVGFDRWESEKGTWWNGLKMMTYGCELSHPFVVQFLKRFLSRPKYFTADSDYSWKNILVSNVQGLKPTDKREGKVKHRLNKRKIKHNKQGPVIFKLLQWVIRARLESDGGRWSGGTAWVQGVDFIFKCPRSQSSQASVRCVGKSSLTHGGFTSRLTGT